MRRALASALLLLATPAAAEDEPLHAVLLFLNSEAEATAQRITVEPGAEAMLVLSPTCPKVEEPSVCERIDVNGDGVIGLPDWEVMNTWMGRECGP